MWNMVNHLVMPALKGSKYISLCHLWHPRYNYFNCKNNPCSMRSYAFLSDKFVANYPDIFEKSFARVARMNEIIISWMTQMAKTNGFRSFNADIVTNDIKKAATFILFFTWINTSHYLLKKMKKKAATTKCILQIVC